MPLPNRVDPFGDLFATPTRGTVLFGNRGGKFHRDDRRSARGVGRRGQWICCVLKFRDASAMCGAATTRSCSSSTRSRRLPPGHRPCFECRRQDAERFAVLFFRTRSSAHRRTRWIRPPCRAVDAGPSELIAAASTRCRMVRWLHSTAKSLPSRQTCCLTPSRAIRHRNPALAILRSTCSRRHRSSPYSDEAMRHSGIRAQAKVVRSAGCWSQPGRGAPRRKTRWQT